jgi:TctA family transporter
MDVQVLLTTHSLPLWFLVLALFLPRISLALLWLENALEPFHLGAILGPVLWLVLPRALVVYVIYLDQGISLWLIIHAIAAVMVWGGSGRYHTKRRKRDSL